MTDSERLIRITDVSPRDGLQNEPTPISTAEKAMLVHRLSRTGVDEVEVSSFVSPKWVPQLGDAADVFAAIAEEKPEGLVYSALVPNLRGLEQAIAVNDTAGMRLVDKVSVFTAASETFSRKNTNASIDETIERFEPVVARAADEGFDLRGYISCVVESPFEGAIEPNAVARVARSLLDLGIREIDLGDTIGKATPQTLRPVLDAAQSEIERFDGAFITLHLHDTFGGAADCVREALDRGVGSFDGSAAGLGGCPYATTEAGQRAPGNISTETLVRAIEASGYSTGVQAEAMREASAYASDLVQRAQGAGGGS